MAQSSTELELEVYIAWWWSLYVAGMRAAVFLTGAHADEDKVREVAQRAVRLRVANKKAGT